MVGPSGGKVDNTGIVIWGGVNVGEISRGVAFLQDVPFTRLFHEPVIEGRTGVVDLGNAVTAGRIFLCWVNLNVISVFDGHRARSRNAPKESRSRVSRI